MPDLVRNLSTTLSPDEVMVRAVQFFTTERWRAQSQTNRIATFVGMPKVPLIKIIFLVVLTFFLVVPGLLYYLVVISKLRRMHNIVVTTTPDGSGCSVVITYPKHAQRMVDSFTAALPGAVVSATA
jgi:hypothetical protein